MVDRTPLALALDLPANDDLLITFLDPFHYPPPLPGPALD